MSVIENEFGKTKDGAKISLYTITNKNGMRAQVTDFGAILVSLEVPDATGKVDDVVLGYASPEGYFVSPSFFGATVGPNANRVGGAQFTIDDNIYQLDKNDGNNNLHSHIQNGYHKRMWTAQTGENFVCFSLVDEDGSMGFPGNKECILTYTLTDTNRIEIHYHIESDKKTLVNMTNHTYFNLEGHDGGSIEEHSLWLKASHYTPVVMGAIPTGEIVPVKGTPMDFTDFEKVGSRINDNFEQLKLTGGYDHNWVIDDYDGSIKLFACVKAPKSGRVMKAYTNLPGVQFYAGNFITPEEGKKGVFYKQRNGLCLETQFYPDTANKPQFPSAVFGSDRIYDYTTIYEFASE
ncbi:MAG TPA: aldose epimerase family protein [Lachnospiraceae bacterium]|nr:aldose epimerase family protein [Lachnospiraceae bacterium]